MNIDKELLKEAELAAARLRDMERFMGFRSYSYIPKVSEEVLEELPKKINSWTGSAIKLALVVAVIFITDKLGGNVGHGIFGVLLFYICDQCGFFDKN